MYGITSDGCLDNIKESLYYAHKGYLYYMGNNILVGIPPDPEMEKYTGEYLAEILNLLSAWEYNSHTGCGPCRDAYKEKYRVKLMDTTNKIREEMK